MLARSETHGVEVPLWGTHALDEFRGWLLLAELVLGGLLSHVGVGEVSHLLLELAVAFLWAGPGGSRSGLVSKVLLRTVDERWAGPRCAGRHPGLGGTHVVVRRIVALGQPRRFSEGDRGQCGDLRDDDLGLLVLDGAAR